MLIYGDKTMTKTKSDYFAEGALIFADTAMVYSLFKLWYFINSVKGFGIRFMPFVLMTLFIYCANVFLSRKCPYVNAVYIFNVCAAVFSVFMGIFVITSPDTNTTMLSFAFKTGIFAFLSVWTYAVCKNKMLPSQIVLHVELAAALIFLFVFLKSTDSYGSLMLPVSLIYGLGALITALILKRTSARNSERTYGSRTLGASIIGIAVVLSAGAAFLISYLTSNIVAKIIETGIKGGQSFISMVKEIIASLFDLLLMLFPADDTVYDFEMEAAPSISAELMETETGLNLAPYILSGLGLALAVLLIYIFIKNRGKLNKKVDLSDENITKSEKSSLSAIWLKIKEKIRTLYLTFLFRIKNRHTIKGLYWQMDDFGKRNSMPRLSGESGIEYIKRITSLENIFTEDEISHLNELSSFFSLCFYSAKEETADRKLISACRKIFRKRIPKENRPLST